MRRPVLVLNAALVLMGVSACAEPRDQPAGGERMATVVFVCEFGSKKSLVAARHFERAARERGLRVRAVARGLNPDPGVPPAVKEGLLADGIDIGSFKPRRLAPEDVKSATLIVSFGQDLNAQVPAHVPVLHWDSVPAVSQDYHRARESVVGHVQALIDDLSEQRYVR